MSLFRFWSIPQSFLGGHRDYHLPDIDLPEQGSTFYSFDSFTFCGLIFMLDTMYTRLIICSWLLCLSCVLDLYLYNEEEKYNWYVTKVQTMFHVDSLCLTPVHVGFKPYCYLFLFMILFSRSHIFVYISNHLSEFFVTCFMFQVSLLWSSCYMFHDQ